MHLVDFPSLTRPAAPELVASPQWMRFVYQCRLAHALRKTHQLRVRQPLASLLVVLRTCCAGSLAELIASEVNVKPGWSSPRRSDSGLSVRTELALNPRAAFEPAVRKLTSQLFKVLVKSGEWEVGMASACSPPVELMGRRWCSRAT